MNNLNTRVRSTMARAFNMRTEDVQDNASSSTISAWDSLGQLHLILALQEEFGIELTPEEMLLVEDLEAICSLINSKDIVQ